MKRDDHAQTPADPATGASAADERSERDWGLSPAKPRRGIATKLALVVILALAGAGGYVVFRKLQNQNPEVAGTDASAENGGGKEGESTKTGAPGEPDAAGKSAKGATTAAAKTGDPDPFAEGNTEKPEAAVAGQTEPPARQIPDLDAPPRNAAQAIPEVADAEESLDVEAAGAAPRGQAQSSAASATGEASPQQFAGGEPARTLDVDTEPPAMLAAPSKVEEAAEKEELAEKLEGYEIAPNQAGSRAVPAAAVADAPDDRLGDYVAEELTSNRAVSRTVVKRPVPPTPAGDATAEPATIVPAAKPAVQLQGQIEVAAADTPPQQILPKAAAAAQKPPAASANELVPAPESANSAVIQRRVPALPSTDARLTPIPKEIKAPVAAEAPAPAAPAGDVYTVVPNDNFWKISKKQYGTGRYFMALTRHNQSVIGDPLHMKPGMQVSTPPRQVLESRYPELIEKVPSAAAHAAAGDGAVHATAADSGSGGELGAESRSGFFLGANGEPMYRVGHDDTLTGISQRHLGRASRWVEILEKNRDLLKAPESLKIGTEIRLPNDASRLSLVRTPEERR